MKNHLIKGVFVPYGIVGSMNEALEVPQKLEVP